MTGRYKLYGGKRCGSVPIEAALAEIGAPAEIVELDFAGGEQWGEAYRKINPLGRIPALELPDGTIVTESAACLLIVCERHPEAGLLPPLESGDRGRLYRWLMFASNNLYEAIGRVDYPERYVEDKAAAPGAEKMAIEDLKRFWQMIETHLKPAPFALGERYSALDLYLSVLARWSVRDWVIANCPRLAEMARRTAARPKVAPIWQHHFGGEPI
jgi:GST-like protein